MPQQVNPWFDPNSPITTFGSGIQNTMQGMYAAAMMKKQQDEMARQFDAQQALEGRKQTWEETNTPAFQFGQMTDVTRDKWGAEVPLQDVQENYLKQFAPKYDQTLAEQVQDMVRGGGATDEADAYDKLQKVGKYNIYNTPSRQAQPSDKTLKWQTGLAMYNRGEFGQVGSQQAMEGLASFVQAVGTTPTRNDTPPPVLGEHRAIVGSLTKNLAEGLKAIDNSLKELTSKPELFDPKTNELLPQKSDQKTGGFLGIGGSVKQWPKYHSETFDRLNTQRPKMAAAMKFAQFIQDMVEGGKSLTPNVVNWVNKVNSYPAVVLEDDSVIQMIPALEKELMSGGGTQPAVGGTSISY